MLTLDFCPCPIADWWQWFGDQRWSALHTLRALDWEGKWDLPSLWYCRPPSNLRCSLFYQTLNGWPSPPASHPNMCTCAHTQTQTSGSNSKIKANIMCCLDTWHTGSTLDGFTTGSPALLPWIQSPPKKLSVSKDKLCSCLFFCVLLLTLCTELFKQANLMLPWEPGAPHPLDTSKITFHSCFVLFSVQSEIYLLIIPVHLCSCPSSPSRLSTRPWAQIPSDPVWSVMLSDCEFM